jgi:hypothetical protein
MYGRHDGILRRCTDLDHLLDLLLLGLEAQGAHGHLQLLGINGACKVQALVLLRLVECTHMPNGRFHVEVLCCRLYRNMS